MFSRLLAFWRKETQWRRMHVASFALVSTPNAEGITQFQSMCLAEVGVVIPEKSFVRALHADGTVMFSAPIPNTTDELYIYDTEVGIHGQEHDWRFEEWDYRTPEELIASVLKALADISAT